MYKRQFYHNAPVFAAIFAKPGSQMDAGIMVENICIAAKGLGLGIGIVGLFNIQFIVDSDESVYVIEVNPRASRSRCV